MERDLYVCNDCDEMHGDQTDQCENCGCESIRVVAEKELLAGMSQE